jgi:uroporphyrin-III C-methyltransferase
MGNVHPVQLVGAGPGAVDLLTLRAARALSGATAVVHDGLVSDEIMALVPPRARRISVAKRRARHTLPQDDIGALMVSLALDPFIFGRGGEEVAACAAAGVPVEVIPGISAAQGAAAAAQMPLTHRDHASIVSFVAGECRGLAQQDWTGLAGPGRTLVIYMGLAGAGAIADKLICDGLTPDTPVAIIERATTPRQRLFRTLLADLAGQINRAEVASPALIIIGAVAQLGVPDTLITQIADAAPCPIC